MLSLRRRGGWSMGRARPIGSSARRRRKGQPAAILELFGSRGTPPNCDGGQPPGDAGPPISTMPREQERRLGSFFRSCFVRTEALGRNHGRRRKRSPRRVPPGRSATPSRDPSFALTHDSRLAKTQAADANGIDRRPTAASGLLLAFMTAPPAPPQYRRGGRVPLSRQAA